MGLFRKAHNNGLAAGFENMIRNGQNLSEMEFLDHLNEFTKQVIEDQTYSTDDRLAIYELLSQISNCSPADRMRYAKKMIRLLK